MHVSGFRTPSVWLCFTSPTSTTREACRTNVTLPMQSYLLDVGFAEIVPSELRARERCGQLDCGQNSPKTPVVGWIRQTFRPQCFALGEGQPFITFRCHHQVGVDCGKQCDIVLYCERHKLRYLLSFYQPTVCRIFLKLSVWLGFTAGSETDKRYPRGLLHQCGATHILHQSDLKQSASFAVQVVSILLDPERNSTNPEQFRDALAECNTKVFADMKLCALLWTIPFYRMFTHGVCDSFAFFFLLFIIVL